MQARRASRELAFILLSQFDKKIINKKYIRKYTLNHQTQVWTIKNKEELLLINNPNYQYICNNLPYDK